MRPVFAPTLAIMVKEPRLGAVKTRLARDIGAAAAMRFYRSASARLTARLAVDPRWRTVLCIAPDGGRPASVRRVSIACIGQGRGNLGARMQRVFDRLPQGPVVIIGTDIPQITAPRIARAFRALGGHDAVLGPAADGGYWLIGLKRLPRTARPFAGVRWSTPHTLADTLTNLEGLRVAMLEELADVDDAGSHRRLCGAGVRMVLPPWWRPRT